MTKEDRLPFKRTTKGVFVTVRTTSAAHRNQVAGLTDWQGTPRLKVDVKAPPEKSKANEAVVKLLAKTWHIPTSQLSVAAGSKNRNKTILISGKPQDILERLCAWMNDTP